MPKVGSPSRSDSYVFIGVDPGQTGSIGMVDAHGKILVLELMPETEAEIFALIMRHREFAKAENCFGIVELVHSMKDQGVASSFKFGMNFGMVRMAMAAADISFELESPQKWIKALGIPPKPKNMNYQQGKERLRQVARRMFPKFALWNQPRTVTLQRQVTDGLLIAERCRRKHKGIQ